MIGVFLLISVSSTYLTSRFIGTALAIDKALIFVEIKLSRFRGFLPNP